MIIENVLPNKLHQEFLDNGIECFDISHDVEDGRYFVGTMRVTFAIDADRNLIDQIIAYHDPTPVPPEPTEIDILGLQLVEKDLQIMDLQETIDMLGQQIVEKDIQLMDVQAANDMLGQNIVSL